jgi:uncharacterized membrane protein YfcA
VGGLDPASLLWLAGALAAGGAVTGVLAGLFGVGGGAITVPVLFEVFRLLGTQPEIAMPLAVGTSLAIIIPTSIRSALGHYRKGAVDLSVLRAWALPILVGVLMGTFIARYAGPAVFQGVFVAGGLVTATKLLFARDRWKLADEMPRGLALRAWGWLVGIVSALMGIGGGAISTIILTLHGRQIHQSVATSAGVGVLISIPGALGYMASGWGRPGLPPDAVGFVSLLGVALIVPMTLLTAQIGVNLAHSMPRRRLEVLFGLFILTVCVRFLVAMVTGA